LDGTLTALDREGSVHWVVPSLAGPLFSSSLSAVEFGDDAARLIPSLDGSIFHWVGDRLEPLPFTAESLLSPPFQLRDGTLLVGSRDILVARLYRDTGKVIYLCSASGCHLDFGESSSKSLSDVLSVRRIQQTVRAIEGRTGLERWNFTVGQYELSLSEGEGVEANTYDYVCSLGPEDWELQIMASEGVITAIHSEDRQELWSHQFSSPLSAVWSMDGPLLRSLPLFHGNTAMQSFNIEQNDQKTHPQFNPLIILAVGSHKGQLYVHSSTPAASIPRSFAAETVKRLPALVTGDPSALPTYSTRTDRVPHTTEMTVYTGEADYFPQGETMYFYSEGPKFPLLAAHSQANDNDNDSQMCQKQESTEMLGLDVLEARLGTILILVAILFAIKYVRRQKVGN
jgi:translation initiation factor 2-alpha kinase 3